MMAGRLSTDICAHNFDDRGEGREHPESIPVHPMRRSRAASDDRDAVRRDAGPAVMIRCRVAPWRIGTQGVNLVHPLLGPWLC